MGKAHPCYFHTFIKQGMVELTRSIFYVDYFEFGDFYQLHIGNKTRSEEMGPPLQTFRSMELCPMLLI